MTAEEFYHYAVRNGYAMAATVKDFMRDRQDPYTEDDLYDVYRLDEYRLAHEAVQMTGKQMIEVEG